MKLSLSRRTTLGLLIVAVIAVVTTGTAYAAWQTTGSGTGSATTGTMTITANALTAPYGNSSSLIPGGAADAVVSVTNPNGFAVTLTSVTARSSAVASNGCSPTGVTFNDQSALSVLLDAGTTQVIHLPSAVSMSTSSANACQGASFSIPVTVTVQK